MTTETTTEGELTDQEIEYLISLVLKTIVIVIVSYYTIIRPLVKSRQKPSTTQQQQRRTAIRTAVTGATSTTNASSSATNGAGAGSNFSSSLNVYHNQLIDGIQPYRVRINKQSKNSDNNTSKSSPDQKARERHCLQLLSTVSQTPSILNETNRASNVVVTVRPNDMDVVAFLSCLGNACNLFVILDCSNKDDWKNSSTPNDNGKNSGEDETKRLNEYVTKVKEQMNIDTMIIPSHRIIACTSMIGRIAFVRQLNPSFVVDHTKDMKDQLSKFGFTVILYGSESGSSSSLGDFLSKDLSFKWNVKFQKTVIIHD